MAFYRTHRLSSFSKWSHWDRARQMVHAHYWWNWACTNTYPTSITTSGFCNHTEVCAAIGLFYTACRCPHGSSRIYLPSLAMPCGYASYYSSSSYTLPLSLIARINCTKRLLSWGVWCGYNSCWNSFLIWRCDNNCCRAIQRVSGLAKFWWGWGNPRTWPSWAGKTAQISQSCYQFGIAA